MTPSEQEMYRKLEQQYGNQYYIFPQINLDKLVEVTDKKNYYHYFNKINRKSVDFVLADKNTFETVQVIELDDWTHGLEKRKKRDNFLHSLMKQIELKIIRV